MKPNATPRIANNGINLHRVDKLESQPVVETLMNCPIAIGNSNAINNISIVRLAIFLVKLPHLTIKYLSLGAYKFN